MVNVKHFKQKEFACKCGCEPPSVINNGHSFQIAEEWIDEEFLVRLELLRRAWGKPISVTSGYRCAKHNKNVGGAKNSKHRDGIAADLVVPKKDLKKFAELCDRFFMDGGFCLYTKSGFVHVDGRGRKARW